MTKMRNRSHLVASKTGNRRKASSDEQFQRPTNATSRRCRSHVPSPNHGTFWDILGHWRCPDLQLPAPHFSPLAPTTADLRSSRYAGAPSVQSPGWCVLVHSGRTLTTHPTANQQLATSNYFSF